MGKIKSRDYHQNCALARASDLLGERWTLLIVRDLLVAPRRFGELEKRAKGMGTNLLSTRLKQMVAAGLVTGGQRGAPYMLTDMGRELEPTLLSLVRWSRIWVEPLDDPTALHYPDWDLIALKACLLPDRTLESAITANFAKNGWNAWVRISESNFDFGLGAAEEPTHLSFPCYISELQSPDPIIAELPAQQRAIARLFLGCFETAGARLH